LTLQAPIGSKRECKFEMVRAGGRTLRAAVWKAESEHSERPLLFFNGIGANIEAMAPLADWFADRDLVTFDMPGVGKSPDPVVPYTPWSMAWRATRVMDTFGYAKADVMGVSWGGGMAQQFAFQHASRAGKLVLAATSAGMVMVPGNISSLSKMASPRRYMDPDFLLANFRALYGGDDAGAHGHVGRLSPPSRRGYLYQLGAMLGWTSAWYLPFLRAKTLILMGKADHVVPPVNGTILQSLMPNARLELVEGGHLFLVSRAREVAPLIRDFLAEPDVDPVRKRDSVPAKDAG
jgi:poly(3-hydroxyalkanoate) depolymerase